MFAEHIVLDAPESVDDRRNLMHDVEAISVCADHFLKSAHLTFDAAQMRDLFVVFDFDATMVGNSFVFFIFFQFRCLLKSTKARRDGRFFQMQLKCRPMEAAVRSPMLRRLIVIFALCSAFVKRENSFT